MSTEQWEKFFNSEVCSSGYRYFKEEKVSVSQPSDTEIQAYIKSSTPCRVNLKSPSMTSPLLIADCNCAAGKKGRLCKHIWATLLATDAKLPEFLDGKEEIENRTSSQADSKTNFYKAKQDTYRKEQYQRQKQRLKDQKQAKKRVATSAPALPQHVEMALAYFSENGFQLENSLHSEAVGIARKKLSRIFHPDIGGSHDEIVELNRHAEVLLSYLSDKA